MFSRRAVTLTLAVPSWSLMNKPSMFGAPVVVNWDFHCSAHQAEDRSLARAMKSTLASLSSRWKLLDMTYLEVSVMALGKPKHAPNLYEDAEKIAVVLGNDSLYTRIVRTTLVYCFASVRATREDIKPSLFCQEGRGFLG